MVEDLHWADPSTLDFLALLAEQGATAPLLLVLTARSEFRPPWPLRAHHAQMTLNRLSKKHVLEMITCVTMQLVHALIQETAYGALLKSRRRELHHAVAEALVKGGSAASAVLAYHWEAAGEVEAAVAAWQQAAEQAQRSAAVLEAEAHYRRAVAALGTLPDGPARAQIELPLQIAIFTLLMVTRGPQDTAAEEAVTRAGALAERLGDVTAAVLVLTPPWAAAAARNEHRAGLAIARQMERLAERDGAAFPRPIAQMAMGISLFHLGELDAARAHLGRVLALFNDDDFRWFPMSPKVLALGSLAYEAWLSGRADSAQQHAQEAAAAATQRGVLSEVAHADVVALVLAGLRREPAGFAAPARRLLDLCATHDLPMYLAAAQVFGGWIIGCEESPAEGLALLRKGLQCEQAEGGTRVNLTLHLSLLAELYAEGGALAEALATLDEAFAAIGDEEIWRPDLLRLRGDLLIAECGIGRQSAIRIPQSEIGGGRALLPRSR